MNLLDLSKKVKEELKDFLARVDKEKSANSSFITDKKAKLTLQSDNSNLNGDKVLDSSNNYEPYLVKLEQDIRMHIKTEFQLKIYCESLESKIETLDQEVALMKNVIEESKIRYEIDVKKYKLSVEQLVEVSLLTYIIES